VVEVSGKWRGGGGMGGMVGRNAPITFALIVISLLVAALTQLGADRASGTYHALTFKEFKDGGDSPLNNETDGGPFRDILRGQVWRLVTPIFLHFGVSHIVFNCLWMFMLASQVEERRGPYFYILLILVSAIISNAAEALYSPAFGGMSGVGYAIFGY